MVLRFTGISNSDQEVLKVPLVELNAPAGKRRKAQRVAQNGGF